MRGRASFVIGAIVALIIGLSAGAAFAYFTSNGSGTASASTGTVQSVHVVAASGTVSSKLIPGSTADLLVELNNPNSYSVTLTAISQQGPVTVVGGSGCTSDSGMWPSITLGHSGVSVLTQTGLSITVASGSAVVVHVPNDAFMSVGSASACQGLFFQVPVTVTVQR